MIFKIKTSKKTMKYFSEMEASLNFPPYILSKLAIALSLKSEIPLTEQDLHTDNNGLELNRQTITAENDLVFKCLIEMFEKRHLSDEEYLQTYIKAHLDRGAAYLYSEHKYGGDFLERLLSGKKGL